MPSAFTLLPVVLVLVFVAAGASKLGRHQLVSATLEGFRMPTPLQHPAPVALLPIAELLLGLVLFASHGWVFTVAAVCAVLVTGVFVVIVARALARGDRFDCGCFGAAVRTPISGALLTRNVLLLAAALGSVGLGIAGFGGVVAEIGTFTTDDVSWAVISVLVAALAVTTFRTPAAAALDTDLPERDHTLSPGGRIPDVHLDTLSGTSSRILDSIADRPHLLVFAKAGCRSCHFLLQQSPQLTRALGPSTGMLLLVLGDSAPFEDEHPRLAPFALYGASTLASRLGISSYPAAALLTPDGTLLAAPAIGAPAIHELAAAATDRFSDR